MAKKKSASKKTDKQKKMPVKKNATKTSRRATKTKQSSRQKSTVKRSLPKVRVQMFRQGLGDSFLVTFDDGGPNEKRMLIDCGTLGSKSSTKTDDITKYLDELVADDKRIDILIATHEHQDHVSAFKTKAMQKVLTGNVDHVWLAWTENPDDAVAQRIAKYKQDLGLALSQVARVAPDQPACQQVADLLGFAGEVTLGADFAKTVHAAMEFVRTGTGGKTAYLKPGDLIGEGQLPGFRIYVLGPPKDDESLKNLGSHQSDELYGIAASLRKTAVQHISGSTVDPGDNGLPFDIRFNQYGERLIQEQYPTYLTPDDGWRRIDYDWIAGASELAIQLDSLTNNTSLALAIERIEDGKVLLFPADAQLGSWLSWHDENLTWTVTDSNNGKRDIDAADLLSRTVFYKVGHHGSHNATARSKGLELMTKQDELVAFIPVDRAIALGRNPKNSWQMPARPLYLELLNRCQGRVVRADLGWATKAVPKNKDDVEFAFKGMGDDNQWTEWTKHQKAAKHVTVNNKSLCFEYVLN